MHELIALCSTMTVSPLSLLISPQTVCVFVVQLPVMNYDKTSKNATIKDTYFRRLLAPFPP